MNPFSKFSYKAVGFTASLIIIVAALLALVDPGHLISKHLAWHRRAALHLEPAPFDGLAASQVGYSPHMRKEFSSPKPFTSFRVIRVDTKGETAFRGGAPIRTIASDDTGAIRTVWLGDFSSLNTEGRYRIVADNGLSTFPFDIRVGIFDNALRSVQRAFYFQRAFTEIDAKHADGPWTHASDAALAPPGIKKGWHDAGDFSIYSASTNSALFWMLSAFADFSPTDDQTGIPESSNGIPDLLDEARWGLEWLLSSQAGIGAFHNTTCQDHYGSYGTNLPESMSPYRLGEIGTIATGRAVGTLAFASALYRGRDPAFSDKMLTAATLGYRFLHDHPTENSDGPTCPAMREDQMPDIGRNVRMYAAAGMLLATGEARFNTDFEANVQPLENDPSYLRSNVYAALLYLRARAGNPERQKSLDGEFRRHAAIVVRDGSHNAFGWAGRDFWGSIAAGFQRTAGFSAPRCLQNPLGDAVDCEQILANVHHAFGRNYQLFAYVSGLQGVTRGRRHGFHEWLAALDAQPYLFPGIVAGGPNVDPEPNDVSYPGHRPRPIWGYWDDPAMPRSSATPFAGRYTDNDSWSTNELDIDWQGVTLYNLYVAQWLSNGAPARHATLPYAPISP